MKPKGYPTEGKNEYSYKNNENGVKLHKWL